MIRHVLLVRFISNVRYEQIQALKEKFKAMPSLVDGVESVEWGENNSPEGKDQGYSHVILMTFRDHVAREHYLPHPEHTALKAVFRPILEDIIVLDYNVTPE
ncbi:Dabb family protein [Salinivibrio sp. ES.052]|uniref:Dabb family protein n=1 Tax=Salinivibrio sp. ES.052 TaxID=1882823 RepID=UPI00092C9A0F|nr:Dabb family protein [Salinivibrio sp. ES.052]SIN92928.1 Stress responsive A/B Barrel Domain [Salinivibrio sp. ES.052]